MFPTIPRVAAGVVVPPIPMVPDAPIKNGMIVELPLVEATTNNGLVVDAF